MQERSRLESNGDPSSFNVEYARVVVGQVCLDIRKELGLINEETHTELSLKLAERSKRLLVNVAQKTVRFPDAAIARISELVIGYGQISRPIPEDLERRFLEVTHLSRSATILN